MAKPDFDVDLETSFFKTNAAQYPQRYNFSTVFENNETFLMYFHTTCGFISVISIIPIESVSCNMFSELCVVNWDYTVEHHTSQTYRSFLISCTCCQVQVFVLCSTTRTI